MAIEYDIYVDGDLLRVKSRGEDGSLDEVRSYGMAVLQECLHNNCVRVLCDERKLEYRLDPAETYELAKAASSMLPKLIKIAIVCRPQDQPDAHLYQTVATERGLQVRIFLDIRDAETWLMG